MTATISAFCAWLACALLAFLREAPHRAAQIKRERANPAEPMTTLIAIFERHLFTIGPVCLLAWLAGGGKWGMLVLYAMVCYGSFMPFYRATLNMDLRTKWWYVDRTTLLARMIKEMLASRSEKVASFIVYAIELFIGAFGLILIRMLN